MYKLFYTYHKTICGTQYNIEIYEWIIMWNLILLTTLNVVYKRYDFINTKIIKSME